MRHPHGALTLVLMLAGALSLQAVEGPRLLSSPYAAQSFAAIPGGSSPQEEGGEVTKANWQQHPKIRAVRAVVQSIKNGMAKKSLTTKRRAFEYCEPGADTSRVLATDAKGRARFYQTEGGSEDSSLKFEHYYDEGGRLRFVFITAGAVNGSQLEQRIYFDEAGKRIWEEHAYKKGPGYTWPEVWPEDELQLTDAAMKFSSASPCPEAKSKAGKHSGGH